MTRTYQERACKSCSRLFEPKSSSQRRCPNCVKLLGVRPDLTPLPGPTERSKARKFRLGSITNTIGYARSVTFRFPAQDAILESDDTHTRAASA